MFSLRKQSLNKYLIFSLFLMTHMNTHTEFVHLLCRCRCRCRCSTYDPALVLKSFHPIPLLYKIFLTSQPIPLHYIFLITPPYSAILHIFFNHPTLFRYFTYFYKIIPPYSVPLNVLKSPQPILLHYIFFFKLPGHFVSVCPVRRTP